MFGLGNDVKPAAKSKSIYAGVITAVLGILSLPDLLAIVPLEVLPYITMASGILSILLRFATTQPVSVTGK